MANPPAVQIFMADFFMDTVEWSVDEVGIYWRLLQAQWVNESLPNDIERLARIAGCGPKKFSSGWKKVKSKFQLNGDGRFQNERLEETRENQRKYRELLSEAGKRGVEKKRKLQSHPFSQASSLPLNHPPSQKQALQSSSSIKDKKRKNIKKESLALFNQFWKAYPVKKSKGQAEKAWKKINPDQELLNKILKRIEKAKKSEKWIKDKGEYIPYPATWLNAKGWEDEDVEVLSDGVRGDMKDYTRTREEQKADIEERDKFLGRFKMKDME